MPTIPVMRPLLGDEEARAAAAAVASGWVAQGPRVAEFEKQFAARIGAEQGIAVSSCTAALHLCLVVLGIGPGDEVVVPSLSFIATANAARYVGATPVFADVEAETGNLSVETIESVLSPRTRAVLLVHQAGVPADRDAIKALLDPHDVPLVEDAACAAGSTYSGRPVGTEALLAAWSFHPRKLLTTGEGGMITTSHAEWATRLRRLREHGMDVSASDRHSATQPVLESYLETGFNYRMTDIQAAIGLVQLQRLNDIVARRRQLAARYQRLLSDVPGLLTVRDPSHGSTNYQSFWIVLPEGCPVNRNTVLQRLAEQGVSARRGIMAAHREPAYAGQPHVELPVTEWLTDSSLILPLFHDMTEQDQDRVVTCLRAAMDTT
jgi:dTDP-4-amino-4,6-dideoxygalactose transaminase